MKRIFSLMLASAALALLSAGCGGSSHMNTMNGTPNVTIQTGDSSNDHILKFEVTINSITLTGASGTSNTSNLLSQPTEVEFSHEAGEFEPLTLANVPQGTYTGATVTVSNPEVVAIVAGVLTKLTANLSSSTVNVTFMSSITVGASPLFINFDLDLANSVTINGTTANISLTFKVTTSTIAPNDNDEDDHDGLIEDVHGTVTSIASPNFTLQTDQSTITFLTNGITQFRGGLTSLGDVKVGDILEVDGLTLPDGTKLAIRVELEEPPNGMEVEGIISAITGNPAAQITIVHQVDSTGNMTPPVTVNAQITQNTQFLIRLNRLNLTISLPPFFDASHIGKGQRVEIDSSTTGSSVVADKVKLREQALTGTVSNLAGNTFTLNVDPTSAFATLSGVSTVNVILINDADEEITLTNGATIRVRGLVFVNGTTYTMVAARDDDDQ